MSKPALLLTANLMPMIERQVGEHFEVHKILSEDDPALAAVAPRIVAMCTGSSTKVKNNDALYARLPGLKIISSFGVGYDHVDANAAAKRGILVANTPDVLNEEVADTALGLLLMTVRELGRAEQYLRAGHWAASGDYRLTSSLRDRKVGMVGYGRIGKAIAKRVQAFGVPVAYFGRTKQADVALPFYTDVAAMARDYNTLIVITPGGAGTKDMINAAVLKALGPEGIVINVARGSVVDETALVAALKARTIHAAGLDVMWGEPKINPELMTLENCVLLPHVGSGSINTRDAMGQRVVDNLKAYLTKSAPLSLVAETPFKAWA
jgi:lactate dehydrogenase-like 2-hydroxyacid dehydrogenase